MAKMLNNECFTNLEEDNKNYLMSNNEFLNGVEDLVEDDWCNYIEEHMYKINPEKKSKKTRLPPPKPPFHFPNKEVQPTPSPLTSQNHIIITKQENTKINPENVQKMKRLPPPLPFHPKLPHTHNNSNNNNNNNNNNSNNNTHTYTHQKTPIQQEMRKMNRS